MSAAPSDPSIDEFAAVASRPDEEIDLARAALLIARDEYPDLDVAAYLRRLDEMADAVRATLSQDPSTVDVLAALNRHLFLEQGFAGNAEDFSDPRNSYLNDVLDRRLGIPITLSVVYLELGWRLGLPLAGVSFPGHFLVRCEVPGGHAVLDPFFEGASLGEDDLLARLQTLAGETEVARDVLAHFLVAATKRGVLVRMLRNLKGVFIESERWERALPVCERIARIAPEDIGETRDRARVYEELECFRPAVEGYRRYLALAPDADDADLVRARLRELEPQAARIS